MDILYRDARFPGYYILGDSGSKRNNKNGLVFNFYCKRIECGDYDEETNTLHPRRMTNTFKVGKKKPTVVAVKVKKSDIASARSGKNGSGVITASVEFAKDCCHYGYIEHHAEAGGESVEICPLATYHSPRGQIFDHLSTYRQNVIRGFSELTVDQKKCGNYYRVCSYNQYHSQKQYQKYEKHKITSSNIIQVLTAKSQNWWYENCRKFNFNVHDPKHHVMMKECEEALQSLIVRTNPLCITICEPSG